MDSDQMRLDPPELDINESQRTESAMILMIPLQYMIFLYF